MADASDQAKDALIDAAVQLAARRYHDVPPAESERLLRHYYARVAPQDIAGRDPLDLYAAAVRHLQLAVSRRADESLVRVYNPQVDEDGWSSAHTVIDIVSDDMPFIVDSVLALLEHRNEQVHMVVHPIATVTRDDSARLLAIETNESHPTQDAGRLESFVHLETDRVAGRHGLAALQGAVVAVLADTRATVQDWKAMRDRALELAAELDGWASEAASGTTRFESSIGTDPTEVASLLRWMEAGAFIFVGYREYDFHDDPTDPVITSRPETGLGTLRQAQATRRHLGKLPPEIAARARQASVLNLTKANSYSTVHRAVPLDYIGIKEIDGNGMVTGERRFLGLFTSSVYSDRIEEIPVVRAKVEAVIDRSGLHRDGHDRSRLVNILQRYPRDELFQTDVDDLADLALDILDLRDRRQVSLLTRRDVYGRFLSVLVFVPRDRHTTDVRLEIQRILMDAYRGTSCRFSTEISDAPLARLHLVIYIDPTASDPPPDMAALQSRLNRVIRNWEDYLRSSLVETYGEDGGLVLFNRYREAFDAGYRNDVLAESAVIDIARLEQLDGHGLDVQLHRPLEASEVELRCKLYRSDEPITLSQFIPLLHDLGATVTDERPYEVTVDGENRRFIYDIGLRMGRELNSEDRARMRDAVLAVWRADADSDSFARLVVNAGLTWRDVTVLRAYARYVIQIGSRFTPGYVRETLNQNPRIAALLIDLFSARLEPGRANEEIAIVLRAELAEAIDSVASLDADRILRLFVALVEATVRTNHWQRDAHGELRPALALKLEPSSIPDMPRPVPAAEIFVFSPRTEGVHLRAGLVARGGLRWSDRMADYRTEILGLLKAQTVKNSVIVPVGAKGGFVAKKLPDGDRDAITAEVVHCYETFIGALLDVTDNLVEGKVVAPGNTVCHDGEDPYLVVAADKGTAAFSDIANAIALRRDFWLGDAFASGGSSGYDHKALGITARGAWISVEAHLAASGIDPATDSFTVVGIGDMSGDVFGNGMLRSDRIRLVAAFDHRHIFIDPSPDPSVSFAERTRLVRLARSTWADYDRTLLSPGGGIFDRSAKSIALSDEIIEALAMIDPPRRVTPNELIQAVLSAPVDLLWNGGVGTYVKASDELDADIGDRGNDAVRVDADRLRCRVLVEGGNLGVSQRGRISFARRGGAINTDAIDNSAGVDCSDHEVNVKILLDEAVRNGDLTAKQRAGLLRSMADDVCAHVLASNDAQNVALDCAEAQAVGMVEAHQRMMAWLEDIAGLDRDLEALPADSGLAELRQAQLGLTRPELAVLLAYTKNCITEQLLYSDLPADPAFDDRLTGYFPVAAREAFPALVLHHPLRRELVATLVANDVVNRGGISMVHRLVSETSATATDIARAFVAAWEIFELESLWVDVASLGTTVARDVHTAMYLEIKRLGERGTRWLLRNESQPIDIPQMVDTYARPVHRLLGLTLEADGTAAAGARDSKVDYEALIAAGVHHDLALRVALAGTAFGFLDLSSVARRTGENLDRVAGIYRSLDVELDLAWLRQQIVALPRDDHWQTLARSGLRDEFFREHAALTESVIGLAPPGSEQTPVAELTAMWLHRHEVAAERCRTTLADIRSAGQHDLARVSVAVRALSQLSRTR